MVKPSKDRLGYVDKFSKEHLKNYFACVNGKTENFQTNPRFFSSHLKRHLLLGFYLQSNETKNINAVHHVRKSRVSKTINPQYFFWITIGILPVEFFSS